MTRRYQPISATQSCPAERALAGSLKQDATDTHGREYMNLHIGERAREHRPRTERGRMESSNYPYPHTPGYD